MSEETVTVNLAPADDSKILCAYGAETVTIRGEPLELIFRDGPLSYWRVPTELAAFT